MARPGGGSLGTWVLKLLVVVAVLLLLVVEPVTALGNRDEKRLARKQARSAKKAARHERRENKKAMRHTRKHSTPPPTPSANPFVPATGGNSTAPAKDLQGSKPIPTNKGKFFKARASVGGPPGTTDPVLQDTLNGSSTQSLAASAWNEQQATDGRRALAGDGTGWNFEEGRAHRRRLTPMLRGNFAGISATG